MLKVCIPIGDNWNEREIWEEGYHPKLIQNEKMMIEMINYIHQNPIKKEDMLIKPNTVSILVPGIIKELKVCWILRGHGKLNSSMHPKAGALGRCALEGIQSVR